MGTVFLTLGFVSLYCKRGINDKFSSESLSKCKATIYFVANGALTILIYLGLYFSPKFYETDYSVAFGTEHTDFTNFVANLIRLIVVITILIGIVIDIRQFIKPKLYEVKFKSLEKGYSAILRLISIDLIFRLGMIFQKGTIDIEALELTITVVVILWFVIKAISKSLTINKLYPHAKGKVVYIKKG